MSLFSAFRGNGVAPKRIYLPRDRFHVLRVYTTPVSTQVVNHQSVRNFSYTQFITKTVCLMLSANMVENTVTVFIFCT